MTPRSLTHQKVQFGSDTAARVHFFVTSQPQSAPFGDVAIAECVFPSRRDHRMRLSVECAFPHLDKRGATSRKDAVLPNHLTKKHTLCANRLAAAEKFTRTDVHGTSSGYATAPQPLSWTATSYTLKLSLGVVLRDILVLQHLIRDAEYQRENEAGYHGYY